MLTFIIRRSLLALLTIWSLSVLSFVIVQLPPGDFVDTYVEELFGGGGEYGRSLMGGAAGSSFEETLREQYGLNRPMFVQYYKWAWKIVRSGDFGLSLEFQEPVRDVVLERLLMTVILAGTTAIFSWALSIPIGIYSAVRQHKPEDYAITFVGFIGLAVPDFLLALWLLWITFVYFPDQSIGGLFSPEYIEAPWSIARVKDLISHLWIAAFVVGTAGTAALIRVMRANLLDELNKPYVVTARAKGLPGVEAHTKIPGADGPEPAGEHPGIAASGADVGLCNRVGGDKPADRGPAAAARTAVRGPVRFVDHRATAGDPHGNRHADVEHLCWAS